MNRRRRFFRSRRNHTRATPLRQETQRQTVLHNQPMTKAIQREPHIQSESGIALLILLIFGAPRVKGDEEGWGKKKSAYYSTNAGDLNEGDETSALYLEEASRLQHKALSALSADDFGLHDYSLFQGFSDTRYEI